MIKRSTLIFGLSFLYVSALWLVSASVQAVERAVAFVFDLFVTPIASKVRHALDAVNSVAGPALAYDGPPVHLLRHEAGVSKRSAARHT